MRVRPGRVGSLRLYVLGSGAIAAVTVLLGWPFLDPGGRMSLALAAGIAFVVQVLAFGALTTVPLGSHHFLAIWAGSTIMRGSVIAGAAFVFASLDTVDLVVALLSLVGLFMAMIALELWVIMRDRTGA